MANNLKVGYARVNITPPMGIHIAGYYKERIADGVLDELEACAVAVGDGKTTALLITIDHCGLNKVYLNEWRENIAKATGVPAERIMLNPTHAHSGPDLGNTNNAAIVQLLPIYYANVAQAAKEAMNDRSPATMETGVSYTEGLNFVRHYTTSRDEIYGDNISLNGYITGHTSDPDNQIQLIRFRREAEDKKDILAVNWQAHPKLDSTADTKEGRKNRRMLSADYVGAARDYVEANSDVLFAFYLGAAGNLNTYSKIRGETVSTNCKEFGDLLGGYIMDGMEILKPVEAGQMKVTLTQRYCEAVYDHSEDYKLEDAQKIYKVWTATNSSDQALQAAPDAEIYSPYHAQSIITRSQKTERSKMLELNAIRVGSIAFATFPYEMFDVNGLFVKEGSPFDTTFILSMSAGTNGYVAAEYTFQGRGTYEVHNRQFEKGTAENMASIMVEMLNELK